MADGGRGRSIPSRTMSRASAAGFADFFPAAPRAAKNKAKERQRTKSKALDSPSITPVSAQQDGNAILRPRDESRQSDRGGDGINGAGSETAIPALDDNDSPPGDLLNGVGSASSHTSTISSVFSAPTATSTFGGPSNLNILTPLTTDDSSPPGKAMSPQPSTTASATVLSRDHDADRLSPKTHLAAPQLQSPEQISLTSRIHIRDPNRGVKGEICTYDPWLDPKLVTEKEKKKGGKPIYKSFGLVCTQSAGSVILLVKSRFANGFIGR